MNKTLQQEADEMAREYVAKNTAVANGSNEQYEAGAGYREGYEEGYIAGASKYEAQITRLSERVKELEEKLQWEELRCRGLDKPIEFTNPPQAQNKEG